MNTIELLLMRHGAAEDYSAQGDSERQLTDDGRKRVKFVAEALSVIELDWDGIVSSPYRRARQTAEIMQQHARRTGEIPALAELVPAGHPSETVEALVDHALQHRTERLLAVGHNPNVTSVLGHLIARAPGVYFSVATADVAHVWLDVTARGVNAAILGFYPSKAVQTLLTE